MCVPSKTLCPILKCFKGDVSYFTERDYIEPKQHSSFHSVSFVMYTSGAKFEEHCSNISGNILDSVFYCLGGTIYGVITFLICIIQKRE